MHERATKAARAAAILLACSAVAASAATITVNTLNDDDAVDGFCSFREARTAVNDDIAVNECPSGDADGDVIEFSVTGTIAMTTFGGYFFQSVEIRGPGADLLTIDAADLYVPLTFGNRALEPPQTHRVSGLTLRRGTDSNGGGLSIGTGHDVTLEDVVIEDSTASVAGGGIWISYSASDGPTRVTLERVTVRNNDTTGSGAGIALQSGGGILIVRDSTIAGNDAENHGGGLYVRTDHEVTVERSTISGNTAGEDGGGIYNVGGTVSVVDSTIHDNSADFDADESGNGGGIYDSSATTSLRNSIVAGNHDLSSTTSRSDVSGSFDTLGFNLVGDNTGAEVSFVVGTPNPNDDTVGTSIAPIDPELGALADNGGATPTHLPLGPGWPTIDQGSCSGALRDQRGYGELPSYHRILDDGGATDADDGCDVGAVEAGAVAIPIGLLFANGFEPGTLGAWSAFLGGP